MKEFIEKLIGRLEENQEIYRGMADACKDILPRNFYFGKMYSFADAISIVNELAEEYNGGWIPCSEAPENFMLSDGRYIPFLVCDDLIWHPYIAFYDGEKWTKAFSIEKPKFWQPLPEAYKGE